MLNKTEKLRESWGFVFCPCTNQNFVTADCKENNVLELNVLKAALFMH